MISFAQVVAALAAGALLAIATVLVLERYNDTRHSSKAPEPDEEAERERKIEAARCIAVDAVETFRQQVVNGTGPVHSSPRDSPPREAGGDEGAVRRKAHLSLFIGGSAAALGWLATGVREAIREHRSQVIGATVGAAVTATAVTTLTLAPWSADTDNDAERPPPGPTSPPWHAPSPPAPVMPPPPGSSPTESPSPSAPGPSASPSVSPSASLASPSASPAPSASPTAAASGTATYEPVMPAPSGASSPSSGETGPAPGDSEPPATDEPPGQTSPQPDAPAEADACVSVGLESLLDLSACVRGS